MIVALALLVLAGGALGLLGGGGTILTVPVLVYALELDPKQAIATSLLVVAIASAAGMWRHRQNVDWRQGAWFGAAGMVGAYAGGRLAVFLPGSLLLALFAAMMLVTGIAMLRKKPVPADRANPTRAAARIVIEGVAVGGITGLVGAGGGFLVVPALLLLGGLDTKRAIATSLLVVAMKSSAGLAGYLGHVDLDLAIAMPAALATLLGAVGGAALSRKLPELGLRRAFGVLVLVAAAWMIVAQLPVDLAGSELFRSVFVERWPWWAGGAGIALVGLALLWSQNQLLGVSTGVAELCQPRRLVREGPSWRVPFLAGIVLGGVVAGVLGGTSPTVVSTAFEGVVGPSPWTQLPLLAGSGVLLGFGARRAGGCTSGHAINGVAQGARASLVATLLFLVGGLVATHALGLVEALARGG